MWWLTTPLNLRRTDFSYNHKKWPFGYTYPHFVQNNYDILPSAEHNRSYFEECFIVFLSMKVKGLQYYCFRLALYGQTNTGTFSKYLLNSLYVYGGGLKFLLSSGHIQATSTNHWLLHRLLMIDSSDDCEILCKNWALFLFQGNIWLPNVMPHLI